MSFKKYENTITQLQGDLAVVDSITDFEKISNIKKGLDDIQEKMEQFKKKAEETDPDKIIYGPATSEKILKFYKIYKEVEAGCEEKYPAINQSHEELLEKEAEELKEKQRLEEEERLRKQKEQEELERKLAEEKAEAERQHQLELQKAKEEEERKKKEQEERKKKELELKRKQEEEKTKLLQQKIEEEKIKKQREAEMKLKEEEYYLQEYIKKYPIQYADNYLPETHIPPLPLYGEKEVTESEFNEILYKNKSKLVVIDWFMTTCPPCRMIAPFFASLALSHPRSVFLRANGPEQRTWSASQGIYSFPTFQFYLNGVKVDQFSGADQKKLQDLVDKYESRLTNIYIDNILNSAVEGLDKVKMEIKEEEKKLSIPEAYEQFKARCSSVAFSTAISTLKKLLTNIMNHPNDPKFRTIKKTNQAFMNKVSSLPGSIPLIHAVGFKDTIEEELECFSFDDKMVTSIAETLSILDGNKPSQRLPYQQQQQQQQHPPPQQQPMGGFPGMGGMNNPLLSNPNLLSAAQRMAQNPQMMQMAQQMMSNGGGGDIASMMNNPQMMQMAQQMMQDPQMMQMAQQMMQNPQMMQQMMNGGGLGGLGMGMGMGNGFGAGGYSSTPSQPPPQSQPAPPPSKKLSEMTEDELLQEAMRLSEFENQEYKRKEEEEKKKKEQKPPQ